MSESQTPPAPTVGRIMHFYAPEDAAGSSGLDGPYAALVTGTEDIEGELVVHCTTFGPSGSIYPHRHVPVASVPTPGCVNYPPRV